MKTIKLSSVFRKLGKFKNRVENMESPSSYDKVPNQFILHYKNGTLYQSYRSIIAVRFNDGTICLSELHEYSLTTRKYAKKFCDGKNTKERRERLEDGRYLKIVE